MLELLSMSTSDPTTEQLLFDDVPWRSQIIYVLSTPHCYAALHTFCLALKSPNDIQPTEVRVKSAMHLSALGQEIY